MTTKPKKQIEQIVAEVGKYPMDAFIFVQECIGTASEQVHGPLTSAAANVAKWMAKAGVDLDELQHLSDTGNLPNEIAHDLIEAGGISAMNRHVTGGQLCWAIRDVAIERWGRLARTVLDRWNLNRTEDIGEIIFALVNNDWLQKQPTDHITDFAGVYPFDQAFSPEYKPSHR